MYSNPLTSTELTSLQDKAEKLVISQGEYAFANWKNPELHSKGSEGDIVTATDVAIEENLTKELTGIFPQAKIFGEENGGEIGSEYTWLIDPIDGTKHFAHRMPSFFVQVALIFNKEPIIGIIFDPVTKQLFSASLGNGAFLNGEKMANTDTVQLSNAVIDVDLGGKEDIDWKLEALKSLVQKSYRVRVSAGRFAPYLLTGGISAFVVLNPTTKSFDQLPRVILAREAGFEVVDFPRNKNSIRIMGDKKMVKEILEAIGLG